MCQDGFMLPDTLPYTVSYSFYLRGAWFAPLDKKNSDDLYLPIVDNSAVKSIRSLPYTRGYKNRIRNINEECPICTESITVEHALMVMTCCHVMHADWMLTWCLNQPTHRKTCPVCRAPMGLEIHIFTYWLPWIIFSKSVSKNFICFLVSIIVIMEIF